MATLPVLSPKEAISGKRIFVRVDWNVPLKGMAADDSVKVSRSLSTIANLASRGAVVMVATHLGRPKGRDASLSTKALLDVVASHYRLGMTFLPAAVDTKTGLEDARKTMATAKPGAIFLLENVRFYAGEEKNSPALSKAYASLADLYVNDAFASCHRSHASVVGIAKYLPSYAGPNLVEEVGALDRLLTKPKKPYIAIIGGAKISTKVTLLETLLASATKVFVGGAMANAFFAAQKKEIGGSFVEKEGIAMAKKLLKNKNLMLPTDVVVAKKIKAGAAARAASVDGVKKSEAIGDIGPQTMVAWSKEIRTANTIVWNGPLGVTEIPTFSHGSLVVARAIAARSRGEAYGVVGGGDTLPVMLATGMSGGVDHLSTGGGAMLEFLTEKGKLPGIVALTKKKS